MASTREVSSRVGANYEMEIPGFEKEEESSEDRVGLLPKGVNFNVLSNLEPQDLITCSNVCRRWKVLADTDVLWKGFIPESIIQKNKVITEYKKYVTGHTISEGEVACKIQDFNNSIKQNETGRISFRFLDDRTKEGFLEIGKFFFNRDETTSRSDEDLKSDIRENPLKEMIYFVKRSQKRQDQLETYKKREFSPISNFSSTKITEYITETRRLQRHCFEELRLNDSENDKLDEVLGSLLMGKDIDMARVRELFPDL
ncbi:MAG: hypothetical protein K1060chlam4_00200 [Candidatus Anoxychlamydiales bacterium]|nr:hypothetical protein [Candidatus Anoxychlamydiales bacterium]